LRSALADADDAPSSPSQTVQASSSKIAGMRGSSSPLSIVRRMRSSASTITITQNGSDAGWPSIAERGHTTAKPRHGALEVPNPQGVKPFTGRAEWSKIITKQ